MEVFNILFNQVSLGLLTSVLLLLLAYQFRYFSYPQEDLIKAKNISFYHVVIVFLIFIFTTLVLAPGISYFLYFLLIGTFPTIEILKTSELIGNWISLFSSFLCFIFLIAYVQSIPLSNRKTILGLNFLKKKYMIKDVLVAMFSWIIAMPMIFTIDIFIEIIMRFFTNEKFQDQIAVVYLRKASNDTFLLVLTIFSIIVLIPFIEELLFRGLFQTWVKQYTSRTVGIFLSSILFAIFHLASSQGIANIEIFIVLFVFSLFLGFVYERQQSLFASISLHSIFNLISVIRIFTAYP